MMAHPPSFDFEYQPSFIIFIPFLIKKNSHFQSLKNERITWNAMESTRSSQSLMACRMKINSPSPGVLESADTHSSSDHRANSQSTRVTIVLFCTWTHLFPLFRFRKPSCCPTRLFLTRLPVDRQVFPTAGWISNKAGATSESKK